MKTHLEEHEITTAVAGLELEVAAEEHLGSCVSCRQQVSATRAVIDARLMDLVAEAPDWDRQRQEIMLQLPSRPTVRSFRRRPWARPLLAIAAVLVVAIGLRVLWTPTPEADPGVVSDLPVEQILAEVDAMLADDSIPGLELLDQGLDDAIFENGAS
jgi:predicted anti-sigma-YlaC factor YlaD